MKPVMTDLERWSLLLLLVFAGELSSSGAGAETASAVNPIAFVQRQIVVDGNVTDWDAIVPQVVRGADRLWFGQGMTRDKWDGDADLSYQWRGAWFDQRLFFLFEITDDRVIPAGQPSSYLCDAVEIYLDYDYRRGQRVKIMDGRADWFARCDPRELMGYELHFLPVEPTRVYLDHADKYALEKPQTARFKRDWAGTTAFRKTKTGYILEVGFRVPGVALRNGKRLGVEIGICDDDGPGRESIMMWTGTKADFWLTMDDYGTVVLAGADEALPPRASKPPRKS